MIGDHGRADRHFLTLERLDLGAGDAGGVAQPPGVPADAGILRQAGGGAELKRSRMPIAWRGGAVAQPERVCPTPVFR